MKSYLLISMLLLSGLVNNTVGQLRLSEEYFNASKDIDYRPKSFEEAILQLNIVIPDSIKQEIKQLTEDDFLAKSHFGTGLWIRNEWLYDRYIFGLVVRESDLRKDLVAKGLFHNDDMSGVIIRSFYRYLNNQSIEFDQQIEEVHEYWVKVNEHYHNYKTNPDYKRSILAELDSIQIVDLEQKKLEWLPGKRISGYVDHRCGLLKDFSTRTQVEGTIIEWDDDNLLIHIDTYTDENKKNRVIKCNAVENNRMIVNKPANFRLLDD